MQTTKEIDEQQTHENKQKARMAELQEELAQTIKRIEQLQRGAGGSFGGGRGAMGNNTSGNRRGYGSGNRGTGSANRPSPYGSKNSRNSSNGAQQNKYGIN